MGPHAQFAWQHDGRWLGGRTITVFDDGAAFFFGPQPARATHSQSRGLVLDLDETHKVVRTARAYVHHPRLLAYAGGNMETMPDGDVVIGWGGLPVFSRLAADDPFSPKPVCLLDIAPTARTNNRGPERRRGRRRWWRGELGVGTAASCTPLERCDRRRRVARERGTVPGQAASARPGEGALLRDRR